MAHLWATINRMAASKPHNRLYQPQANSFMPKAQNAPDGLNQGYGSMPWIFVSSEEDARNRIVQPNQTAWFMDNNNPYFY